MLTQEQKEIVREAYAKEIAAAFRVFEADEVIQDIYLGGEDPGQWGNDNTVVTILNEMRGIPSSLEIEDYSEFGVGPRYFSEDWMLIDERVRKSTGFEVFSEPVNYAVMNVWEI